MKQEPPAIRRIAEMLTGKYIQRCHQEGIALVDFARTMQEVTEGENPPRDLLELFAETMSRCRKANENRRTREKDRGE